MTNFLHILLQARSPSNPNLMEKKQLTPLRVAGTGAHMAHNARCASELQLKSRTYRFYYGKKLGNEGKKVGPRKKLEVFMWLTA